MNNVQEKVPGEYCSGCAACFNACPVGAIQMKLDTEGFIMPEVSNACINCGKCVKVCPSLSEQKDTSQKVLPTYSFQGEDVVRKKSSSGGAFYYLAQEVLENDGIVFGAVYDKEKKIIRHASTDEYTLEEIQRSKYAQSSVDKTYTRVREELAKKRKVLFAGTPCQAAGLRNYLGKDDENLLIVDFVCHGVPATKFFHDTVLYEEKKIQKQITNVTFREKDNGWRAQVTKFYHNDQTVETYDSRKHYYYYSFINNISLRRSCFHCDMPQRHASDITLLDFWQSKKDDNKGTSACILNTERGAAAFEQLKNRSEKVELSSVWVPKKVHSEMRGYKELRPLRESFFRYYSQYGIEKLLKNRFCLFKTVINMRSSLYRAAVTIRNFIRKKGKL